MYADNKKSHLEQISMEVLDVLRSTNQELINQQISKIQDLLKEKYHPVYKANIDFLEGYSKRNEVPIEDFKDIIYTCINIFNRYRLYEMVARCRVSLALTYLYTFKMQGDCLEELVKAELFLEKHSLVDTETFSECLLTKGSVYFLMEDIEKCTEVLLEYLAIPNFEKLPASGKFISHVNLARNYAMIKDYDKCEYYLNKGEEYFPEYNHTSNKSALYVHRAALLQAKGQWESAIEILKSGLVFYETTNHFLRIGEFNMEIGDLYLKKENPFYDYELGIQYLEKACEIGEKHGILKFQAAVLTRIANAEISIDDYKSALMHFAKSKDLEYEIYNLELKKYIKKIEVMSMTEKQSLAKQGKPGYERRIVEEVVKLRLENEALRKNAMKHANLLAELQNEVEKMQGIGLTNGRNIDHLQKIIEKGLTNNMTIEDYLQECDKRYPGLTRKAVDSYPDLTKTELKILKLIRMGLASNDIALLFGLSLKNIENHRLRLRKKLKLKEKQSLVAAIEAMIQ